MKSKVASCNKPSCLRLQCFPHYLLDSVTHWQLLPETLLPPVCWSSSSCLCLPWEGTHQAPASTEEHESLPPAPLDLERDVSKCCQHQPFSAGLWCATERAGPLGTWNASTTHSQERNAWHTCSARGKLCDSALGQLSVITNTTSFPCSTRLSKLNRKWITSLPPLKKGLVLSK